MIRTLLISAMLIAISSTQVFAENTCTKGHYTQVMPDHKGVTFGMPIAKAKDALQKSYGAKARVSLSDGKISVKLKDAHQEVFDQLLFLSADGRVTVMIWSYSNTFQSKLGGIGPAFMGVLKKVKDKVGGADESDKVEGGMKFIWSTRDGMSLGITGKDPNMVVMRFECNVLIDEIESRLRDTTNMGF